MYPARRRLLARTSPLSLFLPWTLALSAETIEFKPFPKQAEFAAIPPTIKEGFFGGAAGPGKSFSLLMDPILKGYHNFPRFHGIIFRETFKQLEASLVLESHHLYGPYAKYNANEHCWTFASGAKIRFGYLARDEQVHDHDTEQYQYVAFDELTAFSRHRYMYLVHSRLRSTISSLVPYSRCASNPLGIGHSWVKERFIKPAPQGGVLIREWMVNSETKHRDLIKRIFIKARITDNPILMKEDPTYILSLQQLPEAEKKSKLYGDWDAIAGSVFTEFRTVRMIDEPENALHVVEPFVIPAHWPVVLAIDWGFEALCWAGFFAISPEGNVYLCEERSWRHTKISVWTNELAVAAAKYHNLKTPVVLDRSAWAQRGEEQTIAQQVEDGLGLQVEQSDSDRISGKNLLHEYLRFKPREFNPPPEGYDPEVEATLYRRKGEKAAEAYRLLFEPRAPELNLPIFRLFNTCPLAQEAIVNCVSNPKDPEDVLEFDGDDPYDGTRYGLKRVHKYFNEIATADKHLKRREQILETYRQTGDMTRMYREMEHFENASMVPQGVRRYNRVRAMRRAYR